MNLRQNYTSEEKAKYSQLVSRIQEALTDSKAKIVDMISRKYDFYIYNTYKEYLKFELEKVKCAGFIFGYVFKNKTSKLMNDSGVHIEYDKITLDTEFGDIDIELDPHLFDQIARNARQREVSW